MEYVAFLRAINVGGRAVVKMTDVCDTFAAAGCRSVRSVIQSGNVLFDAPARGSEALMRKVRRGFARVIAQEPGIALRTRRELEALVSSAPFGKRERDNKLKLYVVFLLEAPTRGPALPHRSSKDGLELIATLEHDVLVVSRRKANGMYGFPNAFVEQAFGVPATSRNWTTINRIAGHGGGRATLSFRGLRRRVVRSRSPAW